MKPLYEIKQGDLLSTSMKFDKQVARRLSAYLKTLRQELAAIVLRSGGFERQNIMVIRRNAGFMFQRLQSDLTELMRVNVLQAWDMGRKMVDDPLQLHGIHLGAMPQDNASALELVQWYVADLIGSFVAQADKRVNGILMRGIIAGKGSKMIMREIDKAFAGKKRGLEFELRRIVKTELSAATNLAMQGRLALAGKSAPSLKKYWVCSGHRNGRHERIEFATNPRRGGIPLAFDGKFLLGNLKALGPHDPGLHIGHKINCGCRLGFMV